MHGDDDHVLDSVVEDLSGREGGLDEPTPAPDDAVRLLAGEGGGGVDGGDQCGLDGPGPTGGETLGATPTAFTVEGWEPVDTVFGDPGDDATYWLFQGYGTGTCGPTSVAMIISDVIDMPLVDNSAVVQQALNMGLIQYDPSNPAWANWGGWSGMTAAETEALFESFGISASSYQNNTINTLADYVEADRSVLLLVDSSELWYGANDDATGAGADHWVQITGVDLVNGVVYLNDPARTDGAGVAVPTSVFMDAWADANNLMITTDAPTEFEGLVTSGDELYAARPPGDEPADPDTLDGAPGTLVLLPFTFHAGDGAFLRAVEG